MLWRGGGPGGLGGKEVEERQRRKRHRRVVPFHVINPGAHAEGDADDDAVVASAGRDHDGNSVTGLLPTTVNFGSVAVSDAPVSISVKNSMPPLLLAR